MEDKIVILRKETKECITSEEWDVDFYLCDCGNHKVRKEHKYCFNCGAKLDKSNI